MFSGFFFKSKQPHVPTSVMKVTVPEGLGPGSTFQATTPDGQLLAVAVPPGVSGGMTVSVPFDLAASSQAPIPIGGLEGRMLSGSPSKSAVEKQRERAHRNGFVPAEIDADKEMASDQMRGRVRYSDSWRSDAFFFCQNNHPILSLFCVVKSHPFDKRERFYNLLCVLSFSLAFAFVVSVEKDASYMDVMSTSTSSGSTAAPTAPTAPREPGRMVKLVQSMYISVFLIIVSSILKLVFELDYFLPDHACCQLLARLCA
jgi:hypothetical protein